MLVKRYLNAIMSRSWREKGEEVMTHQEIKEMLEKQLQLLFEHSSGSEDRDLIGLTSEMCEIIRILETTTEIPDEETMQNEHLRTIFVKGCEIPTYLKHWEDRVKTDAKIRTLRRFSILQGLAILALAVALLWK